MAAQHMSEKKNTFLFILSILSTFYTGQFLLAVRLKICPLRRTNHPHLKSVGDDRKLVYINNFSNVTRFQNFDGVRCKPLIYKISERLKDDSFLLHLSNDNLLGLVTPV